MLTENNGLEFLEDIEKGIESEAIREWGPGTMCSFNREERAVRVFKQGRSKMLGMLV